jgi:hypothetical protein
MSAITSTFSNSEMNYLKNTMSPKAYDFLLDLEKQEIKAPISAMTANSVSNHSPFAFLQNIDVTQAKIETVVGDLIGSSRSVFQQFFN